MMKKRFLAMCLALCLILGMVPVTAFAATNGWSSEYGSTAINATGSYTFTVVSEKDYTNIHFKATEADDYTFTVDSGDVGYGGAATYNVLSNPLNLDGDGTYTRTMKANAAVILSIKSTEATVTLTVTRAGESTAPSEPETSEPETSAPEASEPETSTPEASEPEASEPDPTDAPAPESVVVPIQAMPATVSQAVASGVPCIATWTATEDGTLHIDATPSYAAGVQYTAFLLNTYADEAAYKAGTAIYEGSLQTPGDRWGTVTDFEVKAGQFCVIQLFAKMAYLDCDGTVNAAISFVPAKEAEIEKVQKAFDDVYNDANPITATGTYDVTLLETAEWTMFRFDAPEAGEYTFSVNKGQCGYSGAGSYYTYVPSAPAASFDRTLSAGQVVILSIQSEELDVQLSITKPDAHYTNVHTPVASLAGMPATAEAVDLTATNAIVKISDSEYRLNTQEGPVLYVDLSAEQIGFAAIAAGASAYGTVEGVTYNFTSAIQAYAQAMGESTAYPLTTDLMTFLKAYGNAQGWYTDATVAEPWMFCVYADTGSGDIVEITTLATVENQSVAAEEAYEITWTATEDGTVNIAATPEYAANQQYTAFKVLIYANAGDEETIFESSVQTPGDPYLPAETAYAVEAGQYVVIQLYAQTNYGYCEGTVNATVTFVPYTAGGEAETEELAWDDVYNDTNPITAEGTYALTLKENATWTMYLYTPTQIGFYTITVDANQVGYAGATSSYFYVPAAPAVSFEQEVNALGNSIIFAVSGESSDFNVTIEKTGESQGIQDTQYITWENVHTPDTSLTGQPINATAVNITQAHTAYKVSDNEYRLDSADGLRLYVNLDNAVFSFGDLFGDNGALTLRGAYNDTHYDFKAAMNAYNDVMNGSYWYPLTTDLMAFLQGYGTDTGWYSQGYSPIQSVILGTAVTPWMFCTYTAEGATDPSESTQPTDPSEPTQPTDPNQVAAFTDMGVTASNPHTVTGTAPSAGTLHIQMSGTGWRFQVVTSAKEYPYQTYSAYFDPVADYELAQGETYTIQFWAYDTATTSTIDGTVSGTVSFIPDDGTGEPEQVNLAWDDVYNATNPITATGTHQLTLVANAQWTMFNFQPTEIGVYTITVSSGDIGYAGGTVSYYKAPTTFGASIEREVKEVGNVVLFAIRNEGADVSVTIEKTGESEGNIVHDYIPWENVHTPTAELTVPGGLETVDITVAHSIVKISDIEYRLDSETGPILYVDLEGTRDDGWQMSLSFPSANTIRAEYNGEYYNFRAPLSEYNGYYETDENGDRVTDENGNEIYHEPQNYGMGEYYDVMSKQSYRYRLTTDLLAFIQGWGVAQGWTLPSTSPFSAVADGTAHPDSAWMVVCMSDPNSVIDETPEPVIESASLTLNSVLGVNFKSDAPDGYTMKIAVGSAQAVEVTGVNGVYTVNIMAQDMLETVTAYLYNSEGTVVSTKIFTLSAYVESILALEDVSAQTKTLAQATLTYCQYAAKLQGNYDGVLNALAPIPADAFDGYALPTNAPVGIGGYAYLDEACQLRMRLSESYGQGYTVMVDGQAVQLVQEGSSWICGTAQILPQNYGAPHTFTVMQGETEVYTCQFSVLAYLGVCLRRNIGTADQQNLMQAMYHYYAAAAAYIA